ncbi:MAG: tetratricopeptide repeat protein [Streptosporangiaceae bacterium]|jgi:predicted ATPase/DNA-binding NarL/FixJ family response regulator/DNA-binding transcriptional regulator YiaG
MRGHKAMNSADTRDEDEPEGTMDVREVRTRLGLSQAQFAERLGVSYVTVSRWENGHSGMSAAVRRRLAQLEQGEAAPQPSSGAPPVPLSSFVGRTSEIASVTTALTTSRLLCLVGPGGAGKTRLALEVLRHQSADTHRVVFVAMDQLSDPALVNARVATALGVRDKPGVPDTAAITESLTTEPAVLVLDGAEHVLPGVVSLVTRVLAEAPATRIVVTSRRVLDVPGEQVWPVPVLGCPGPDAAPGDAAGSDAVRLFATRAAERMPGFAITDDLAQPVAELCRRLDGLPLAIELAASWIGTLSVEEILGYGLDLISPAGDTASTLNAVAESSYAMLGPVEQAVLRDLSVFSGAFTLMDAAAIAAVPPDRLVHSLRRMVNSSWLVTRHDRDQTSYRMLDTLREYAHGQLMRAGTADLARERHGQHFATLAKTSEGSLTGPEQARWIAMLERATADLDAALTWAKDTGQTTLGLETSRALRSWWLTSGRTTEGRRWLELFISLASTGENSAVAHALRAAAVLANENGDYRAAIEYASRALRIFNTLGSDDNAVDAATVLGGAYRYLGDYPAAKRYFGMAVPHWRKAGDKTRTAFALNNLATLALDTGDFSGAEQLLEESLVLKRTLGDARSVGINLINLAELYTKTGQTERAAEVLTEAEHINAKLGDFRLSGLIACNQGDVARTRSDFTRASEHYQRALECFRTSGNMHGAVLALIGLGLSTHHLGQGAKAASLLREAETLMTSTGSSNLLPGVRAALAEIGQSAQTRLPDGLTSRQAEILGYLANGMTTKEIAELLVLSTATVDRHIATVYRKLGLANRAQATAYALRHGLIPPARSSELHIFLDSPPPPRSLPSDASTHETGHRWAPWSSSPTIIRTAVPATGTNLSSTASDAGTATGRPSSTQASSPVAVC